MFSLTKIINKLKQKMSSLTVEIKSSGKGSTGIPAHEVKQSVIRNFRSKYGYKVFIETGTYLGDMVEAQKSHFDKVYSIELGDGLYKDAVKRFQSDKNVTILPGDSGKVLGNLMDKISEPAIFWLDGHYSEGITARGEKECPIYEELEAIFNGRNLNHLLLIDDARLFVGKNDYPTLNELEDYIRIKRPSAEVYVTSDIIHVLIKK